MSGKNPLAFLNNEVLRVGDKVLVSDGTAQHECEVVEITENKVVMRCREAVMTLKMTQIN